MPTKATQKAWEAMKPKLGADKIWKDSRIGSDLATWAHHIASFEEKLKGIGGLKPICAVIEKFGAPLIKNIQFVHDQLNAVTHKATRQKVLAFKKLVEDDLAGVIAKTKAEKPTVPSRSGRPALKPPVPPQSAKPALKPKPATRAGE